MVMVALAGWLPRFVWEGKMRENITFSPVLQVYGIWFMVLFCLGTGILRGREGSEIEFPIFGYRNK